MSVVTRWSKAHRAIVHDVVQKKPGIKGSNICTYSGLPMDPFNPDPRNVRVADIAHALSCIPRFTGHTREFYSVAQHSVMASWLADPAEAGYGLFHDAAEAYLLDMPPQIKCRLIGYKDAETALTTAIYRHVGLDPARPKPPSVAEADVYLVRYERASLMPAAEWWQWNEPIPGEPIVPLAPADAERLFIDRYCELALDGWFR